MTSRLALSIEYDGSAYAGSQLQPDRPTIQGALEGALREIGGNAHRVDLAGRTDAGVHARGQVAAFNTESERSPAKWREALNGTLPHDIAVLRVVEVPPDFDPRRDARSRWYRYRLINRAPRPALDRERAWHVADQLDGEKMQEAALALLGRHDFAPFCGAIEPGRTTVRSIFKACWRRRMNIMSLDLVGDAFLPQQVRRLAGALVRVGSGRMQVEEFKATLEGGQHGASQHLAPAHGLYLMGVSYEAINLSPLSVNGEEVRGKGDGSDDEDL